MTDPIVSLEIAKLTVEASGQGRTLVTVRNLGTIVEGFPFQVSSPVRQFRHCTTVAPKSQKVIRITGFWRRTSPSPRSRSAP